MPFFAFFFSPESSGNLYWNHSFHVSAICKRVIVISRQDMLHASVFGQAPIGPAACHKRNSGALQKKQHSCLSGTPILFWLRVTTACSVFSTHFCQSASSNQEDIHLILYREFHSWKIRNHHSTSPSHFFYVAWWHSKYCLWKTSFDISFFISNITGSRLIKKDDDRKYSSPPISGLKVMLQMLLISLG